MKGKRHCGAAAWSRHPAAAPQRPPPPQICAKIAVFAITSGPGVPQGFHPTSARINEATTDSALKGWYLR